MLPSGLTRRQTIYRFALAVRPRNDKPTAGDILCPLESRREGPTRLTAPPPATETTAPPVPKSALFIVFLVVVIDLLGFGIVLPLLPRIAKEYVELVLPGQTGPVIGLLMASFSFMQFLVAPFWGRLSDARGRRPILLLGLSGSVVFYLLFGYACALPPEQYAGLALILFFVARLGQGVAGATIATAQAVIADCTPPEKRKHGMALIGAAFGIGFTFGPLIGAGALALFPRHFELIGYAAATLSAIALILGVRLLPETRQFEQAPTQRRRWIDWSALRFALAHPALAPVVLTFFLASFGFGSFESTLALLLRDSFGFDAEGSFLVFAYIGFVLMVAQGLFYRRLASRVSEVAFIGMGLVLMAAGVGTLGLVSYLAAGSGADAVVAAPATQGRPLLAALYFGLTAAVFGFAFLTPSAQALVSRRTPADRQGEMLGVNQSAAAMARILGPLAGLTLYEATPSHMLPYALGALVLALMLPMLPRIKRGDSPGTAESPGTAVPGL
jgi:DHA1 family tetracycline resistance protein-like MFS transporter